MGTPPGAGLSPSRGPAPQSAIMQDRLPAGGLRVSRLTSPKDPGRDLRPPSGAGVGRGSALSAPGFHADAAQHLAGVHLLDPEPRKWLGQLPRKPLPCETGEPGTGGPRMELSLLLPEIKQGRDWGHCLTGSASSPLCSKCLSHEGTHTAHHHLLRAGEGAPRPSPQAELGRCPPREGVARGDRPRLGRPLSCVWAAGMGARV